MPYIKPTDRIKFSNVELEGIKCDSAGDLNYLLTQICKGYLNKYGMVNYARFNDVVGALECCKLELYRRKIAPYENLKINENGDAL